MEWLAHFVRFVLARWGYLALAAGLLGENAGLPLPGETILMYSSFFAHKSDHLSLWCVILVGIGAAVLGDNLGYFAGRRFGPRLLRWLEHKFHMKDDIATARHQIREHGPATIFWARYTCAPSPVPSPACCTWNGASFCSTTPWEPQHGLLPRR